MKFFDKVKDKVDSLGVYSTDTYQVCPHCNKRVHVTKCRMVSVDVREATHYQSFESVSKTLTTELMKGVGANPIVAKLFGQYAGPKAQRGVEETAHIVKSNCANLRKRETICPNCRCKFVYTADSITKW